MTIHIRKCKHCKQDFILKNIAYEKRGQGKYCSKQCSKYATKKHSFNEHYFDVIDTSTKAYWLGFLMADGCNTENELTVELSIKDKDHLSKLKEAFGATQTISYRMKNGHEMVSLRLASRQFCKTLTVLGCKPNKSFILKLPKIKLIGTILMRDFIRGYFDGDGCISIRRDNKNKIWSIYSVSEKFILSMKKQIEKDTGIQLHKYKQGKNGHRICAMKKDSIRIIAEYFYNNRTPEAFMERKRALLLTV